MAIPRNRRIVFLTTLIVGLTMIEEGLKTWGQLLLKDIKTNPYNKDTMLWLKFLEVIYGHIEMDRLMETLNAVIKEEVEQPETRAELLDRILDEAMRRSSDNGKL